MSTDRENLIASLSEDATPVKTLNPATGLVWIAAASLAAAIICVALFQFWFGMFKGDASAYFWITHGLLFLTGAASTGALVTSAFPRVGSRPNAPVWSAAMLAVIPFAAILTLVSSNDFGSRAMLAEVAGFHCTTSSLGAAALVAAVGIMWLRKGAPVSLERSAWLLGLTAGSLGTIAYAITCSLDSIVHVGIWHILPVAISAVAARLIVPPLIRW